MKWSIDTCQNKVFTEQYPVTILRAQVFELIEITRTFHVFFLRLTADWVFKSFHTTLYIYTLFS